MQRRGWDTLLLLFGNTSRDVVTVANLQQEWSNEAITLSRFEWGSTFRLDDANFPHHPHVVACMLT